MYRLLGITLYYAVLHVYYALRMLNFCQIRPQNGITVACITRNTAFVRTVYYASAYPLAETPRMDGAEVGGEKL